MGLEIICALFWDSTFPDPILLIIKQGQIKLI